MSAAAFTYGFPDGSQVLRPTHRDDRFEMLNHNDVKRYPLPIPWKSMTFGNGGDDEYPVQLEDGLILSLADFGTTAGSGFGPNPYSATAPSGSSPARGSEFYNFAANASKPLYMVWSADTTPVVGPNSNLTANPGQFDSEGVTGVRDSFRAWVPARLLAYPSVALTSYDPGDIVTVNKGRIHIPTSGGPYLSIGRVEKVDVLKLLIVFDIANPHPVTI